MGSIHPDVIAWFQDHNRGYLTNWEPVGGGCIHETFLIQVESGDRYFLKQNNQKTADIFEKEAQGLNALRVHGGPVVPQVFLVGAEYLLLEDLQPKSRCEDYWQLLGRQLAQVHNQVNESFGYQENNYIGRTPQLNTWMQNGHDFFRERRIIPQVRAAQKKALLKPQDIRKLERLMDKLPELIPEQPASLIHGDLCSGNLMADKRGMPAIIDPAVYYGWAEADLAMTDLFGSYPAEFYSAYNEIRPLDPGYRARYKIYNIYHLLVHKFCSAGISQSQVRMVLAQYS